MFRKKTVKKAAAFALIASLSLNGTLFAMENETGTQTEMEPVVVETTEEMNEAMAEMSSADADARVIIYGEAPSETYGADEVLYCEEDGECILQYASSEKADAALAQMPDDVEAYKDKTLTLDNLAFSQAQNGEAYSWGSEYMGMSQYAAGIAGNNDTVTIAIVSTGIDLTNPFFDGRTVSTLSKNFTSSKATGLMDAVGHGTQEAGIIVDCTPSNVELMILRVYDDDGGGSWTWTSNAIKYAVKNGADIITVTSGDAQETGAPLDAALTQAAEAGIPVICAAGQGSKNKIWYPANDSRTIAVSAIDSSGQAINGANSGSGIDFCAPGAYIKAATLSKNGNMTVTSFSGSEAAVPHVASAFAYLKMKYPDKNAAGIKEEALKLCRDLGDEGKDEIYGNGYINIDGLFEAQQTAEKRTVALNMYAESVEKFSETELYRYGQEVADADIYADVSSGAPTLGTKTEYTANNDVALTSGTKTADLVSGSISVEGSYAGNKVAIIKKGGYVPKIVSFTADTANTIEAGHIWLYGDVNDDGFINSKDVIQYTRFFNGQSSVLSAEDGKTEERMKAADVDKSNSVLAKDTTQLTRYINGLTSVLDKLY